LVKIENKNFITLNLCKMTPKSPDSSHDQREEMLQHSENSPNSVEEFPINEFEKIQGRIEKVLREIDVALGQTSILALKV
jgi:hypothetical protein